MQRFYRIIQDRFGNPAPGSLMWIYSTGTTTPVAIYSASDAADNPSTVVTQPINVGSDGWAEFAINDGDYDIKIIYPDSTSKTLVRVNFFDSTTATTIPVSSISLAMPSQFDVAGSPGTAITVTWNTKPANKFFAGPDTGADAVPGFRFLVAADINPVACDLTTNQTVDGNKTFTGATTFGDIVTSTTTHTFDGPMALEDTVTWGATAEDIRNKATKTSMGAAGVYGYRSVLATPYDNSIAASTLPTATTLLTSLRGWAFSASASNELLFCLSIPYDYETGTDIYPYFLWTTTGTNAGNVNWKIDYSVIKVGSTLPAVTVDSITPAASGVVSQVGMNEFAAIDGTNIEPDALMLIRAWRDGAAGADTCSDTAFLLAVGVHYQASRLMRKNKATPYDT